MPDRIRIAETAAEREAVYRFRYEVYVRQRRLFVQAPDHKRRWLRDAEDETAYLFYAAVDGQVVGTLRMSHGARGAFEQENRAAFEMSRFEAAVPSEDIVTFSRFLVRDRLRGGALPFRFIVAAAELATELGVELGFCYCEPHLISSYTKLGFRTYRGAYHHTANGVLVPLVMILSDLDHARDTGSPLLQIFERRGKPVEIASSLLPLIRERSPAPSAVGADKLDYTASLVGFLDERPELPPLFDGLDASDVELLLSRGQIMSLSAGEILIRKGQTPRTLYLVLDGALEVNEDAQLVEVARRGEAVGELALLLGEHRKGNVTAITETVRVLALNERQIRELIERESAVAARFLLYLSKCLCGKLQERSRGVRRAAPKPPPLELVRPLAAPRESAS